MPRIEKLQVDTLKVLVSILIVVEIKCQEACTEYGKIDLESFQSLL